MRVVCEHNLRKIAKTGWTAGILSTPRFLTLTRRSQMLCLRLRSIAGPDDRMEDVLFYSDGNYLGRVCLMPGRDGPVSAKLAFEFPDDIRILRRETLENPKHKHLAGEFSGTPAVTVDKPESPPGWSRQNES